MKKKALVAARYLLGLIFFASGLMGLINKAEVPPDFPEAAGKFLAGMIASGYFLPFVKGCEMICGALLLLNLYVPLALLILSPIVVHIFLFHALLYSMGTPMAIALILLMISQGYAYFDKFYHVTRMR